VTRDEVQPLCGLDEDASYCTACGGSGLEDTGNGDVILCKTRCDFCGGSGYGPAPYALDRERRHCIERLSRWAHRAPCTEEN
jgi:hypothetical protein